MARDTTVIIHPGGEPIPDGLLPSCLLDLARAITRRAHTGPYDSGLVGMLDAWDITCGCPTLATETVPSRVAKVEQALKEDFEYHRRRMIDPAVQYATATVQQIHAQTKVDTARADRVNALRKTLSSMTLDQTARAVNRYGFRLNKHHVKYLLDKPAH